MVYHCVVLTVIIPCFNEELTVGKTIKDIKAAGGKKLRVIVVDNGSTDKTSSVALKHGAEVVTEPMKGKGYAFRRGLLSIDQKTRFIGLIDGDATYDTTSLLTAVKLISDSGYEMVIGNRTPINTFNVDVYRTGHKFGNFLFTKLNRVLFKSDVEDALSGWRVMSKNFALSFFGGNSNFELETELNVHAFRLGVKITNIKVGYKSRPVNSSSKLNTFKDGMLIFMKHLRLWREERPKVAYNIMAIPILIIGGVLFNRSLSNYIDSGIVTHFPSLIVAVGLFIISLSLVLAGIILENNLLVRTQFARFVYNSNNHS